MKPGSHHTKDFAGRLRTRTVFAVLTALLAFHVHGQCPNNNLLYANVTLGACPTSQTVTCIWGGEYVTVNVVAGNTYTFSTCGGATWDTQITLYTNLGAVVGYNDDGCGVQSTVTWTATYTGVLNVLVDQYPCISNTLCANLLISCGTGGGGGPVTASDCPDAVNVCTNINFQVDPNGSGNTIEIPPLGSLGNPDYLLGDGIMSPWGSDNYGCLRVGELNSTWMVINIWGSGSLEFTFGGLGTQAGFYDWIMYPYTAGSCTSIMNNQVPPVRCNWNGVMFGGTGLASATPPGGDPSNFEPPLNVLAGQQYIVCFSNYSSVTTLVPLQFGGSAIVSCDPVTLPIELVHFGATVTGEGIQLAWSTATEENSARFVVERSGDLDLWEVVAMVPGAGHSLQPIDYNLLDPTPLPSVNFYRLRHEDHDGSHGHSAIVSAWWREPQVTVWPNPGNGTFHVRAKGAGIEILDAFGRRVPFHVSHEDDERVTIQLTDARPGMHTLLLREGDAIRTDRLIVE